MKFPILLTATALALGTTADASPTLRLPMQMQQTALTAGGASTKTTEGRVEQQDANAGWLHLISGDDDDDCDDDDDDDGCDDDHRNTAPAAPQAPSTPPRNGLFSTGKSPAVKSN